MSNRSTKKRRDAWGSLTYDARRKVGRIRYWAETKDGYRRCSKTYRNVTRKQLEEKRAQLMLEHGEDAPCPTIAQAWERWVLPTYEHRVADGDMSPQSLALFRSEYNGIAERWGDVPMDEVRAMDLQAWLLDGKTLSQANAAKRRLAAILDYGQRYEYVASNVARVKYVMPAKSTTKSADKGVWSLAQLGEVWKHVHGKWYEAAFILSAFGSCRVGESLSPMADEVEHREVDGIKLAIVPIVRQVANNGKVSDNLKNSQSRRSVVVAGRAAEILLSIAHDHAGDWLTGDGMGGHTTQKVLIREWGRDVPKETYHPFRNLRNSWQTNMRWEMGVAPYLIEVLMGHKTEGVTGQYYDRPQVDVFCETVSRAYAANPYDAGWTWLD